MYLVERSILIVLGGFCCTHLLDMEIYKMIFFFTIRYKQK